MAGQADPKCTQYCLRSLNTNESQELLRRKVFGDNNCPVDLEEYELQILQKCNGVPLALLLVTGVLLNDRDEVKWWKKVAKLVNDHVAVDPDQSVLDMLRLSYNQLPDRLKPCFLYLGTFPEYFEIPVCKLLQLWIAEGFIQQDENLSLADIADGYLEDLIYRNLVMAGKKRSDGKTKTCHIHPMIGEFCKEQGAANNLFREIKSFETRFRLNNCQRLCINSHLFGFLSQSLSDMSIRSFLSFGRETLIMPDDLTSSFAKSFKILRVLDARPITFPRFPSELLNLVHLKYLTLSGPLEVLPKKLSCLRNLQTLIVETSSGTLQIEANIFTMAHFRYLHTNVPSYLKDDEAEPSINASLQTLSLISPETCKEQVLERTPNLIKLGVCGELAILLYGKGEGSWWLDSISKLGIQNLKLLNHDISYPLPGLPCETNFPSKLIKLTLSKTMLDWSNMVTLGKLKNLEVLKLKDNAFQGVSWVTEDGGFRRLKILHIGRTNLITWKASAIHFPMLSSIFLRYCTQLEAIPGDFSCIPSFQKIDLYCTNSDLAFRTRKLAQIMVYKKAMVGVRVSGVQLSIYPPEMGPGRRLAFN